MRQKISPKRDGNVLVLTLFFIIGFMALLALSIDIGAITVADSQAQRSADAAAIAATWELIDFASAEGGTDPTVLESNANASARQYAALNRVFSASPELANSDITVGYLANPSNPNEVMQFADPSLYNAVRVNVRRSQDQNGEIPLFFARVMGLDSANIQSEATAAVLTSLSGFRTPGDGSNLQMLPFSLDEDTWDDMLAGGGTDDWTWDAETGQVTAGSDGIREVNLYPQGTGSPGNRGTVDIGSSNNSTCDISRQIVDGISPEDLEYMTDNAVKLDENGELELNGDTGISAGVKDELESIKGEPRIIPIFRTVTGPGNNAQYTIVCFAGVRILEVKLTGKMSSKRVIIQPAPMVAKGGIAGSGQTSQFVYSPVWLVR